MPPLTCFLAPPLAEAAEKAEKTVDDITCAGSSVSGGQIIFRIFDSFAVLTWRLRRSILLFLAVQFQRVKCSGCNCAYVRLRRFYLVFYFFLAIEFGHANLGQNGLFLRLGLLPKLIFKIAPINPYKHKTQSFILFLFTFPASHPMLYSLCNFFLQNPSPTSRLL